MSIPYQLSFERLEQKYPLAARFWHDATRGAADFLPVERFDGVHDLVNVRTTYLDSKDLQSYREYVNESPVRRKLRIRQYGYDGRTNGVCWVEIKIKNHGVSLKQRFRCTVDDVSSMLAGQDIAETVARQNDNQVQALRVYASARESILKHDLRPVLSVLYERMAFQSPTDAEVRLTVDRRIQFKTFGSTTADHHGVVLEAKFAQQEPVWLGAFLGRLQLEESQRFSKYARGVGKLRLNGIA